MKGKMKIFLLLLCVGLIGVFFINAVDNDFEKETGGVFQIKSYNVVTNTSEEAKLQIHIAKASKDNISPSIKILSEDDPIYEGEQEVIDKSLGKYRVELSFTDVRLQKNLMKKIGRNKQIHGDGQNLLESIKISYPPDDSRMVMYIGCNEKPQVDLSETNNKIIISLRK